MSPNLRRKKDLQGTQTAETADGNLSPRTPRVDRPARLDDASAHPDEPVVQVHRRVAVRGRELHRRAERQQPRRHAGEDAVLVAAVTEADRLEAWG